jgi:hypothetical protein
MYSLSTPLKSQERLQAQRPQSWRFLGWTHHTSSAPPPTILGFDVLVWLLCLSIIECLMFLGWHSDCLGFDVLTCLVLLLVASSSSSIALIKQHSIRINITQIYLAST